MTLQESVKLAYQLRPIFTKKVIQLAQFESFVTGLKREGNEALIESIQAGIQIMFEGQFRHKMQDKLKHQITKKYNFSNVLMYLQIMVE